MDEMGDNKEERSKFDPQDIPQHAPLSLDYTGTSQTVSFISQKSSSIESFTSSNSNKVGGPVDKNDENGTAPSCVNKPLLERDGGSGEATGVDRTIVEQDVTSVDSKDASLSLCLPEPDHHSTPVRASAEGDRVDQNSVCDTDRADENSVCDTDRDRTDQNSVCDAESETGETRDVLLPGNLFTPILGFETMEARSKFTVYKIHVQRRLSADATSEESAWFVFRRYSDFVHLNERLRILLPGFRLSLPPKRWFRDNFDSSFLEDRQIGLQAFLDNITGHKELCNSRPVRAFFCTDDPPGPHDSLEESRALCENLEESMYDLRKRLQDKDCEITLLKDELELYKSQVNLLSTHLRVVSSGGSVEKEEAMSTSSTKQSLAECDRQQDSNPTPPPSSPSPPPQDPEKEEE